MRAARGVLSGQRHGWRAVLPFLGPAFIASVAYVDPGNFATNIQSGAQFGYLLLWVVVASNLMAMLIQTLSAKLGIATGQNLAEVCRDQFPRPVVLGLWLVSELGGHGHRRGRSARRGARHPPAVRHAAAAGRPADRRGHVRAARRSSAAASARWSSSSR